MRYLVITLFLCPLIALGQSNDAKAGKMRFHSIQQLGLINGKKGNAFSAESIFGVEKHTWFAGVGIGVDHYYFRSLPLFLDLRKEFGKSSNHFFIYGDGGINVGLLREIDKDKFSQVKPGKVSTGLYAGAGIGYKIKLPRRQAISFSTGFSMKTMKISVTDDRIWMWEYLNTANYKYNFHRLDFKLGWEF